MSEKIIFKTLAAAFLALAVLAGCSKEDARQESSRAEEELETGSLHINFGTGSMTKGGTASDGDIIKIGRMWLIDSNDKVTAFEKAEVNASSGEVLIKNIKRGVYTLCILANCDELDSYVEGSTIDNGFKRKLLPTISDGDAPSFTEEKGMPCSTVIRQEITIGENYVRAHLRRCVGRLTIRIHNNTTDGKVAIGAVGLSRNNPTSGYLFHFEEDQTSTAPTQASFKDLENTAIIANNDTKVIFDSYLYETETATTESGISFNLFGAIYDSDVSDDKIEIGHRRVYNFSNNLEGLGEVKWNRYLIRSVESPTRYMGYIEKENDVGMREFSEDSELKYSEDTQDFLWEFIGDSSSAKLKNVKTGKYLNDYVKMTDNENNAQEFTITNNAGTFLFGYRRLFYYYINYDAGTLSYKRSETGPSSQWKVRLLDETNVSEPYFPNAKYEIPRVVRDIYYVDKHGTPQKLRKIRRNEHITVTVNIFYNREMGEFQFEVEGWSEKDSETTFD